MTGDPKLQRVPTTPKSSPPGLLTSKVQISCVGFVLQVQKALSPTYGGKPTVTMEEIVARLSRAKVVISYAETDGY